METDLEERAASEWPVCKDNLVQEFNTCLGHLAECVL